MVAYTEEHRLGTPVGHAYQKANVGFQSAHGQDNQQLKQVACSFLVPAPSEDGEAATTEDGEDGTTTESAASVPVVAWLTGLLGVASLHVV